jgi:hypothetical protein
MLFKRRKAHKNHSAGSNDPALAAPQATVGIIKKKRLSHLIDRIPGLKGRRKVILMVVPVLVLIGGVGYYLLVIKKDGSKSDGQFETPTEEFIKNSPVQKTYPIPPKGSGGSKPKPTSTG